MLCNREITMKILKQYKKKILKTAIITSPIIGLLSITPILLYIDSLPEEKKYFIDTNVIEVVAVVVFTSLNIFLQWMMNAVLLGKFMTEKGLWGMKKGWQRYLVSNFLLFVYIFTIHHEGDTGRLDLATFDLYPYIGSFVTNSVVIVMLDLIVSEVEKSDLKLQKAELEIRELLAQQKHLKQQIHPHFLFNALGTLQSLITKDPATAVVYSEKLSKYLRTSLMLAQNDLISVDGEINFLEDYLFLQKMRFSSHIHYQFNIPSQIRERGKLPVFALQILFENAIKHNSFSKSEPLTIHVNCESGGYLSITNNRIALYAKRDSAGLGLSNLKERFKFFTSKLPVVEETDAYFKVTLKILDLESSNH